MKKLLPLLVLSIVAWQIGNSQSINLYGFTIFGNGSVSHDGIGQLNTSNGHLQAQSIFSHDYYAYGDHSLDKDDALYGLVIGDSIDMYLMKIDFNTGQVYGPLFTADSVGTGQTGTVTIGGEIGGTCYDCSDNVFYFFHFKAPYEDSIHLAKVDPVSGSVTDSLKSFPLGWNPMDNWLDNTHNDIYLYYNDYYFDSTNYLVDYNLLTGITTQVAFSDSNFKYDNIDLTLNPIDDDLYGLRINFDSFTQNNYLEDIWVIKVDPATGQVTYVSPDTKANLLGANLVIDSSGSYFYFLAQNQNPGYPVLYTFDINGGTLSYQNISDVSTMWPYGSILGIDLYEHSKECGKPTGIPTAQNGGCGFAVSSLNRSTIHVQSGCDPDQYPDLRMQLFDMLGRMVADVPVRDNDFELSVNNASPGILLYRMIDNGRLVQKGKIAMVN